MKNQDNNKDVTLNELAGMVARGFEGMDKKFDNMAGDIGVLKSDVGELKTKVGNLETKVSRIDSRVEEIYDIVVNVHESEILDLQKRAKILEGTVKTLSK